MTQQHRPSPSARYGEDPSTAKAPEAHKGSISNKVIAVLMIVILAGVIYAVARFMITREENQVDMKMTGFETIDDSTLEVSLDITRSNTEIDSYCIITALDYDVAEVGRREVFVPAGGDKSFRTVVDVPTREAAVAGREYGCSTAVPSYLSK